MTSLGLHGYIRDPRLKPNSDGLYVFCLIFLLESEVLICKGPSLWGKCNEQTLCPTMLSNFI